MVNVVTGVINLLPPIVRTVVREASIVLIICALTDVFAGIPLGAMSAELFLLPGLLILVPGVADMRGNIFSSLASRLGTGLHLGLISAKLEKSPFLTQNIQASIILTLLLSIYLGLISVLVCKIFGFSSMGAEYFIFISCLGSMIAASILLPFSILISLKSFERGWDPDNITAPLLTSIGDLITIPSLFFAAIAARKMSSQTVAYSSLLMIIISLLLLVLLIRRSLSRRIIVESVPVLSICGVISVLSGTILQSRIESLVALSAILVMTPSFIDLGGNFGCILGARLSTSFHMGLIRFKFTEKAVLLNFLSIYILSIILSPISALLAHVASIYFGLGTPGILPLMMLSFASVLIMASISNIFTLYLSKISARLNLDPDNVVIPVITSIMDFAGVFCLILAGTLMGLI